MELDKDRLAKLLNLTDSAHDAEALAAIRKANELLRLSQTDWPSALGIRSPDDATAHPDAPESERANRAAEPPTRPVSEPPPFGHLRAYAYRNAFRREPLMARLIGFPFWIGVELLASLAPDKLLDTRGRWLMAVFTLCVILGLMAWIGFGYAALIGFDFT